MFEVPTLSWLIPAGGFVIAAVFGATARRSGFCTMGAISDVVLMGDLVRLRMWVLAMAVAIAGAQALHVFGLVDLSQSLYTGSRLTVVSHLAGGLLFGIGMTLASGCGARNVVRAGAGNLKAVVVLVVLGVVAAMTLRGVLAVPRTAWLDTWSLRLSAGQDLPRLVGESSRAWIAAFIVAVMLAWCWRDSVFRRSVRAWSSAVLIGALVVAGWYLTGHVGFISEHPETLEAVFVGTQSHRPESLTYVAPVAHVLDLLMLWTDASLKPTFGVAIVAGAAFGSWADAVATKSFRWESFASSADLKNHLAGAALMGFGGVTALGCTVGQGLTGISTLAAGSLLTVAAIVTGCVLTLRFWIARG